MIQTIVAGNWKLNKNYEEAKAFLDSLNEFLSGKSFPSKILIAPSFPLLPLVKSILKDQIILASQNVASESSGAFTGEVSAEMLKSVGVDACLIGHSERRMYYNEGAKELKKKVDLTIDAGLVPVFCVGESLEERKSGNHFGLIESQLNDALFHLRKEDFVKAIIAYEPVWAIGTGEVATPEQAQEMHAFIRLKIAEKYSEIEANVIPILYGGSVKPSNSEAIFSKPDVNGGLIGGASLDVEVFSKIIEISK